MRKCLLIVVLFFSVHLNLAQTPTRVVRGNLKDPESGFPMPGVNVMVKGTSIGTVTDQDGNYEIEAPVGSMLVFSFIGYQSRELLVTPESGEEPDKELAHQFYHRIPDDPEKTLSPYFFIKSDNPAVDQMPLKSTSAAVSIAGVIADVIVKQVYVNSGQNPLEAIYIFPGSTRAAVYGMSMTIGNRRVVAKIREKEQARKDYNAAKAEGKSATLLEQKRPNIFQMNVANILPGDTITVELKYTEVLVPLDGNYEFIYPTVVGPRYSQERDSEENKDEAWVENPYQTEGEEPLYSFNFNTILNTGIPVQKISSPSHKITVRYEDKRRAIIALDESEVSGGNRDVVLRYRLRGGQVESGLLLNPGKEENFFLLMVEPPETPTLEIIPPREYIFIVDVSGSMQGFPLAVSKTLLRNLISNLRPTDRFNVMLFESSNKMLHSSSVEANETNIAEAIRVLERQQGGGGTQLYPALQNALAYEKKEGFSRTIVVVTDGYVTIEKEAFELVRRNLGNANLFTIGIGTAVNHYLIEGLAHAGMGEPFIVLNEREADAVGRRFRDFVEKPVLTGIRIDYGDLDVYDIEPVSVPDVFAERPIIIYGKYKSSPIDKARIRVSGYSGTKLWKQTIDVADATSEGNNALRYLWARNKIKYLDDFAQFYESDSYGYGGHRAVPSSKNIAEVTRLGLKYGLLTKYTSFIAIDSVIRNPGGIQDKVKQPLPLPEGVPNSAIGAMNTAGFSLAPDIQALSEVVVVAYGAQSKSELVYSVSSVNSEIITEDPAHALQGRVSGVVVTQNHSLPGASTNVVIRGYASVSQSNSPLFVVDGVVVDNLPSAGATSGAPSADRLPDIDPTSIESIEVLKGGSGTAIYGSRGINGVVLITTKKPSGPRREVEFSSSVTLEKVNKLPEIQQRFAQGSPNNGATEWRGPDTGEMFSWGPAISTLRFDGSQYAYDANGRLVVGATGMPAKAYNPYSVFQTGVGFSNHLRYGRRTAKTTTQFNVGYGRKKGTIPAITRENFNAGFNIEWKGTKLNTGFTNAIFYDETTMPHAGNSPSSFMYSVLTTPATFDIGNGLSAHPAFRNVASYQLNDGTQRSFSPNAIDNPYWSLNNNRASAVSKRMVPSAHANLNVSDWLKLKAGLAGDISNDNQLAGLNKNAAAFLDGAFADRVEKVRSFNADLVADGEKYVLGDMLKIKGTLGFSRNDTYRRIDRSEGIALKEPGEFEVGNSTSLRQYGLNFDQWSNRGFVQGKFTYNHWATLELMTLREQSSTLENTLGANSAGVSVNYADVPFISNLGIFSAGKVFASTARSEREAPLFIDASSRIYSITQRDYSTVFPERIPVDTKHLSAEKSRKRELGTSAEFFHGRVSVDAAWYRNKTLDAYTPFVTAQGAALLNGGELSSKGVDVTLKFRPIVNQFTWTTSVNYSKNRTVVTRLPDGMERVPIGGFAEAASSLIVGQPYGVLVGTKYLRNNGGMIVIGDDGFPLVDPVQGVIGNPNPDWTMGVNNSLSFKSLSLSFLFDIRHGGDIWNGTRNTMNYFGTGSATVSGRTISGYVFPGVDVDGEPNQVAVDFANPANGLEGNRWARYGAAGVGEDAIEDGSWVRLRSLSLTYAIGQSVLSRFAMKKLSVTLEAHNLLVLTKYSGVDPDSNLLSNGNARGIDYFNIPNVKSYGIVLRAKL